MIDTSDVERHNPSGKNDYLSVQHMERYSFALDYINSGDMVLDIACGAGYGTHLLSQAGAEVIGADYDKSTVRSAKEVYPDLNFDIADALSLPYENDTFDVVVTFETIEHVVEGDKFLGEMCRVLKPGGILLCSTPNVKYTSHPSYHVKEYEIKEFFDLIKKYFSDVGEYSQCFTFKDMIIGKVKYFMPKFIKNLAKKILPHKSSGLESSSNSVDNVDTNSEIYRVRSGCSGYTRIMVAVCRF